MFCNTTGNWFLALLHAKPCSLRPRKRSRQSRNDAIFSGQYCADSAVRFYLDLIDLIFINGINFEF